ncbi:MAG: hypothetical protein IPM91_01595 [Bacteroidetes bacterium]|nr:hypothetical protein [Bacteroidota bacterium]
MKHIRNLYLLLLLPLLFLTACGTTKKTSGSSAAAPKQGGSNLKETDKINATYAFFEGQKEKVTGNEQKAVEKFAQCLRIDPKNHAAMFELAAIYNQKSKISDALFFAKVRLSWIRKTNGINFCLPIPTKKAASSMMQLSSMNSSTNYIPTV